MCARTDRKKIGTDNKQWGEFCENLAAEYFMEEGYTIRERRWRMGRYEIDLILEHERTIIFVEVKGRALGLQDPVDAVDRDKRRRIITAADVYLRQLTVLYQYRFDIFTVVGDKTSYTTHHYPDAYLPSVNSGR